MPASGTNACLSEGNLRHATCADAQLALVDLRHAQRDQLALVAILRCLNCDLRNRAACEGCVITMTQQCVTHAKETKTNDSSHKLIDTLHIN